jgi:hypothetical protein
MGLSTSACSGVCSPGFYCPEGSVTPTQYQCATADDVSIGRTINAYASTSSILTGYLENINYTSVVVPFHDSTGRLQQVTVSVASQPNALYCTASSSLPLQVEAGYFTTGNNMTTRTGQSICSPGSYCANGVMVDCPAGRYGIGSGLHSALCSGPCAKGHYCPSGSTSRTQFLCPRGRYGDVEGLSDASCSGACGHVVDCPPG